MKKEERKKMTRKTSKLPQEKIQVLLKRKALLTKEYKFVSYN